jgi:hypothetical protein
MRYRSAPASDRYRDIAGPSQSSDRRDVFRKPVPVMRVADDSRLASHVLGATADHGGDFGGPVHILSLVPGKLVFSYVRALPVTLLKSVMHTSGRVEDESSRVPSGRVAHSRVEASGVEWCQEQWHNGKRVG